MTRIRSIVARISRATGRVARLLGRLTTNAAGHTTVAAYLRNHGATDAWIARWGSAFGRRVAKAHRLEHGTEPRTAWEFTTKGVKRHMAYTDLTHLDEAYTHYLAHKVAGPDLPTHEAASPTTTSTVEPATGRPATLEYVTLTGRLAIRDLTRYTTDEMRQRVSVARRLDARGSSICRNVVVRDAAGRRFDLDAIPEPDGTPAVYTITYTTPDIEADPNAARGFREVPARLVGHVSRLLAQRAASGAIWNIEARQLGRDVTFDIPAFRA